MLRIPVANSNTAPPTNSSRLARSSRWATERSGGQANSSRYDRPQLGQQYGYQSQTEQDVSALADAVDPARIRHPVEEVKGQDPVLRSRVIAWPSRVVGRVGDEAGDELDRDAHQQHQRRTPTSATGPVWDCASGG